MQTLRAKLSALSMTAVLVLTLTTVASWRSAAETGDTVAQQTRALVFGTPEQVQTALDGLVTRGQTDVVPSMILALRYNRIATTRVSRALETLTGHTADGWFEWMLWQEAHPDVIPHESYAPLKLEIFRRIDPEFQRFFPDRETLAEMRIRLEEITWGGVRVDGIPALDNPDLIDAAAADYLLDDDLVFGIEINGDARAYPLRIMGWHEMFNDVVGGVPVALAYCTLCGSGILFETRVPGREQPLVFGSSGLLYRSNKLMFDRSTDSLWNQFTGQPVSGSLVDTGLKLKIRPVVITTWSDWRQTHPDTRVLSLQTGHERDYGSGVVYRDYFASPNLMFPARVDETLFRQKTFVFGIRDVAASKAWPLSAFAGGAVINDGIGRRSIVLVGDQATRTVRAYDRGDQEFAATGRSGELRSGTATWRIEETALVGSDGTRLPRVPGHVAYWFAWNSYLGVESDIYRPSP